MTAQYGPIEPSLFAVAQLHLTIKWVRSPSTSIRRAHSLPKKQRLCRCHIGREEWVSTTSDDIISKVLDELSVSIIAVGPGRYEECAVVVLQIVDFSFT